MILSKILSWKIRVGLGNTALQCELDPMASFWDQYRRGSRLNSFISFRRNSQAALNMDNVGVEYEQWES